MRVAAHTRLVSLGAIFVGLVPSIAAGEVLFGAVQVHKGMCEPSAAVAVPEGSVDRTFIVANDEDNTLRAYRPQGGEPLPMAGGNLNTFLGLDPTKDEDNKADFEGAAWLNGKVYWIGSHSRSRKGRLREQRWQFFATRVSTETDKVVVTPSSTKAFNGLLAAIAALEPRLAEKIQLDTERNEALAPDSGGFNIEGLAAGADGRSLLLGLRSPLLDGEAVVIPFENPEAVVEKNEKPSLGLPRRLDLGGRGIRSIEYSAAAKAYFIVAGPAGGGSGTFDLFTLPADALTLPAHAKMPVTPVHGFAAGLQNLRASPPFQPESMIIDATGKKLHIFSDDGDSCNKAAPTFRSVAITLQ
jgi:hypothetical protein